MPASNAKLGAKVDPKDIEGIDKSKIHKGATDEGEVAGQWLGRWFTSPYTGTTLFYAFCVYGANLLLDDAGNTFVGYAY